MARAVQVEENLLGAYALIVPDDRTQICNILGFLHNSILQI